MPSDAYEVRVRGPVPEDVVADLCADLQIRADVVFHGVERDQSVVHGLLARLRELGIELVDVRRDD